MLRFDQYYSESKAYLEGLKAILQAKEETLMVIFIQEGPDVLRKKLGIKKDADWKLVFDHLVFSGDILKRCVVDFMPFFKNLVREYGPGVLRTVFDIEDKKYEPVFEKLFDLVAVSHGALYDYIFKNKEQFALKIREGKAKDLRKQLFLSGKKYDRLWQEMLNLLCNAVCEQINSEEMLLKGFKGFDMLMNAMREHRSLRSNEGMWNYSSKEAE